MPRPLLYQRSTSGARSLVLEVDAILRETPTFEAQPTDNPVEDGADASDHVIRKNPGWEVEAIVSDSPVSAGAQAGRGLAAWQTLQRLAESGGVLVLETRRGEEGTVILTSVRETRDVRTSGVCLFTASFRRIRIVSTLTVPLPKRRESKTKPTVNNEKQATTAAGAAATARSKSILLGDIVQPLGFLTGAP